MTGFSFTDIAVMLVCAVISAMGMGGGSLLLIYLTAVRELPQLTAQGINLLFFLPCSLVSVIIYARKKLIKPKAVLPVLVGAAAGVLLGRFLLPGIEASLLRKAFAVFLILSGLFCMRGTEKGGEN